MNKCINISVRIRKSKFLVENDLNTLLFSQVCITGIKLLELIEVVVLKQWNGIIDVVSHLAPEWISDLMFFVYTY